MIPLDRLSLLRAHAEISMAAKFLSLDVQDVGIPGFLSDPATNQNRVDSIVFPQVETTDKLAASRHYQSRMQPFAISNIFELLTPFR
jgi:hypothetical protein